MIKCNNRYSALLIILKSLIIHNNASRLVTQCIIKSLEETEDATLREDST